MHKQESVLDNSDEKESADSHKQKGTFDFYD